MATKDELEKENAELKEKIGGLERELEDALESATAGDGAELHERIKELEAKLEESVANGGDEAQAAEVAKLKEELSRVTVENAKLQAALEGSSAKDGGKDARGEEVPDWKKREYDGPMTIEQAEWRNTHLFQK